MLRAFLLKGSKAISRNLVLLVLDMKDVGERDQIKATLLQRECTKNRFIIVVL